MTQSYKIKYFVAIALICSLIPLYTTETAEEADLAELDELITLAGVKKVSSTYFEDTYGNLTSSTSSSEKDGVKSLSWTNKKLARYKPEGYHLKQYSQQSPICQYTQNIPCGPETLKYRTLDGTCNNLRYTLWGAAGTQQKRILTAQYDDGVNAIRTNSIAQGYYLPNPTLIKAHLQIPAPTKSVWSNFFISFGQLVAHEIVRTYHEEGSCDCRNPSTLNSECIGVSTKYDYENKTSCYSMTRSKATYLNYNCKSGPREQVNTYTPWLDLGFLYGQYGGGADPHDRALLRTSRNRVGEETFPERNQGSCPYQGTNPPIYTTADINSEQNVYLTGTQSVWLRHHNYIARRLRAQNSRWSPDTIFQEAKRINIAIYQHVIYNEYLPNLIGVYTSQRYGLLPQTWGYYLGYNDKLYTQVYNEFSTAAFRHHYLVSEKQCWADESYRPFECHPIGVGMVNSTQSCYSLDYVTRGQLATPSYYTRPQISWTMNNWLLKSFDSIGVINILRGRDHGLRGYVYYREWCGLGLARTFDDLREIPVPVRNVLRKLYYRVEDIDLWVGGAVELPIIDGTIGPTFACIVGKQFADLKQGDRHYYENGNDPNSRFTLPQLNTIRGVSLASVVCKTVRGQSVAKWPFLYPEPKSNPFINCKSLPDYDLRPWY